MKKFCGGAAGSAYLEIGADSSPRFRAAAIQIAEPRLPISATAFGADVASMFPRRPVPTFPGGALNRGARVGRERRDDGSFVASAAGDFSRR